MKTRTWLSIACRGLLGIALMVVGVAGARADDSVLWCGVPVPQGGGAPPDETPPPYCDECCCTGSPNYLGWGVYTTNESDLRLPTAGFPLVVARSYLSSRSVDGPLGVGWSSTVTARLYHVVLLFAAPSTYQKRAYVAMPDGSRWTFVDNGNDTFTAPLGRHDTLVRNGDGTFDLTLERSRTRYHFGTDGSLLSVTDEFSNTHTYTYDGNGRIQTIADSGDSGRSLTVTWGADGRISSIRDHTNRQVQYGYTQGALTTVIDAANRTTTYGYVPGRFGKILSQIKDPWNRVITDVTYDSTFRVQSYTDKGETWTYNYAYLSNPALIQKQNSQFQFWVYTVQTNGLVTDRTPPWDGGNNVHTDYYADGSTQQVTDGVGVKTHYVYDGQGNITQLTRDYQGPTAVRFDYAYDPAFPGKVTSITPRDPATGNLDLDWQGWRYDYYQAGSPAPGALFHVYRVRDDGSTLDTLATYEYNSKGQVTKHTSATGAVTDYTYDASNNLWKVTGPVNNDAGTRPVTTYGYDSVGRVTSVTDALTHATTYTYDGLDRIATVTLPKPTVGSSLTFTTTYTYANFDSGTGLVFTHVTDPNGILTKQGHDQYGQLCRVIDAQSNLTKYTFTRGLLTAIEDANNNVTGFVYDPGRRLSQMWRPNGIYDQYWYYGDGSLWRREVQQIGWVVYYYDNLKRLMTREYGGFQTQDFTYTGQSLTQVVDTWASPSETHTLGYDGSYRLSSVTQGTRGTISYQYNADDTVLSYAVQSGPSTTYSYYPDGSLNTLVWSPVAGNFKYRYTLAGQYQSLTFPSGATRNYSYDDQGRLGQLTNLVSGGANLATYGYGYDLNYANSLYDRKGQRVSMTATVPAQSLSSSLFKYEYDAAYQLTKVTYPNVAPLSGEIDSWTYDSIGNRTSSTVNSTPTNYTYQKIGANPLNWQRLLSDGTNSYTYWENGTTQTKAGVFYTSDHELRLTSISGTASYKYDYQGRRTSRTVGASTNTYLYDGLNLVQEEGATSADYLFGPGVDEPLAMRRGGQTYYYVADGLGSVTEVTNSAGTVQNTYLYDAWGQTRNQTGTLTNPFGYTAREAGEAGTLYYRARYYQPSIGRFLSEDPIRPWPNAAADNWSLLALNRFDTRPPQYEYVGNDPVNWLDPSGQHGIGAGTGVGIGIGIGRGIGIGIGIGIPGGAVVGGAAATAATAAAICYAIPACRQEMKCAWQWWQDWSECFARDLCRLDKEGYDACVRGANAKYQACRRGGPVGVPR